MTEAELTVSVLGALANLLLAGAAVSGVVIAWMGLSTWKEQEKWETDRSLAKQILVAMYVRRDAVRHVRNPFGWQEEENLEDEIIEDADRKWKGVAKKYSVRMEKLNDARSQFYPLELEAAAIWGTEFLKLGAQLSNLENDLVIEIEDFVESHKPKFARISFFHSEDEEKENHQIVFGAGSKNAFGKSYDESFEKIESYLRKKLGQRSK